MDGSTWPFKVLLHHKLHSPIHTQIHTACLSPYSVPGYTVFFSVTHIHQQWTHRRQRRVQCLAQGHFDMWSSQTTDLLTSRKLVLLLSYSRPFYRIWIGTISALIQWLWRNKRLLRQILRNMSFWVFSFWIFQTRAKKLSWKYFNIISYVCWCFVFLRLRVNPYFSRIMTW